MVGLRGFEPPTSPTPKECATGLRHSPNGSTLSEVAEEIKCPNHKQQVKFNLKRAVKVY